MPASSRYWPKWTFLARKEEVISLLPTHRLIRLLVGGAFLWLLALLVPGGWLAGVFYLFLLGVLCWRDIQTIPHASQLTARRELPPRFSLDAEHSITLVIKNHSTQAVQMLVRDELPNVFELLSENIAGEIPAHGEARLVYSLRAVRRGAYSFGNVVLRVRHGLGLIQKQLSLAVPDTAKIYPNFRGLGEYQLLAKIERRDEVVRKPRKTRAPGTDFENLRPYIPGEDLRNVDWKATARRGALISRNKQVEKGQQLAVLLDAGRLMAESVGSYSKLEHALKATIMLSFVAQRRGDALAVASFSNQIESFLPIVRGPTLVPRVLESVYAVQVRPVESDYWQVIAEMMSMLRRRSLVILLTDVLDAAASAGLINNLTRAAERHLVLCVVLSNPKVRAVAQHIPATVEQTYQKAAAADLLRRRRLALEHMRARGILVLESDPEHLNIHLVQRYLEIRQADLQ
jgi:uncharacterized protein (DUF58 family)